VFVFKPDQVRVYSVGHVEFVSQVAIFDGNAQAGWASSGSPRCSFGRRVIPHCLLSTKSAKWEWKGSGCDVWTLARVAGHSNISISQRYVHPSENAVSNALSRLSGHNSGHNVENVIPVGSGELLLSTSTRES
jgi:hypothetical protein